MRTVGPSLSESEATISRILPNPCSPSHPVNPKPRPKQECPILQHFNSRRYPSLNPKPLNPKPEESRAGAPPWESPVTRGTSITRPAAVAMCRGVEGIEGLGRSGFNAVCYAGPQ